MNMGFIDNWKYKIQENKRRRAIDAIRAMTDQDALKKIALEDADLGWVAFDTMTDLKAKVSVVMKHSRGAMNRTFLKQLDENRDEKLIADVLAVASDISSSSTYIQLLRHINSTDRLVQIARGTPIAKVRMEAVRRIADPAILVELARSDSEDVRIEAARCLSDPAVLAELARGDASLNVRACAVVNPHMTDAALLAVIALNDENEYVRQYAVEKACMDDIPALAGAALDKAPRVQIAALQKPVLIQAIEENGAPEGWIACVPRDSNNFIKHDDQMLIASLMALADDRCRIPEERFSRLRNQPVLIEWAASATRNAAVRRFGIPYLHDQATLVDYTLHDENAGVREAAARRVEDGKVLVKVALEDPVAGVREAAVGNPCLVDSAVLSRAALEDPDVRVRRAAAGNPGLVDSGVLKKLALEDADIEVRRIAAGNPGFADSDVLKRLALEDPDVEVRRAAAGNPGMSDAMTQERLALEDADAEVRKAAAGNPGPADSGVLEKLALEAPEPAVRLHAIRNPALADQTLLARIALAPNRDLEAEERLGGGYTAISKEAQAWRNVRLGAIEKLEDTDALTQIADDSDEHGELRWPAGLRLSRLAPERAIAPLVKMMAASQALYIDPQWRSEAVDFLKEQYRNASNPEGILAIRTLPNAWYGTTRQVSCYEHSDSRVHFDLSH